MTNMQDQRRETRFRHGGLLIGSGVIIVLLILAANRIQDVSTVDDRTTTVADLAIGDCFMYPGDDVVPSRVETVDCSAVHFAEVFGVAPTGADDECVPLFESYTGAENYWETGYILGFIEVSDTQMLCYLFAAEDFVGSLANF